MTIQRIQYIRTKQSVTIIQAFLRGQMQQKRFQVMKTSAIVIQSVYRMSITRKRFLKMKTASVRIQSVLRMRRERILFHRYQKSSLVIQTAWRTHQEKCHNRISSAVENTAAVSIQSFYKMSKAKSAYQRQLAGIVTLQSVIKTRIARRDFLKKKHAATALKSLWRAHKCRQQLSREREAALYIQSFVRGRNARARVAAMRVEARERRQKESAILIQSVTKMYLDHRRYRQTRKAVIVIQSFARMIQQRRQYNDQKVTHSRNTAAVCIQTIIRMYLQQRQFQRQRKACIVIQRVYRAFAIGYPCYLKYHVTRGAIITIQALVRGNLVRRSVVEKRNAICFMQASIRRNQARRRFLELRWAAVVLQKNARRFTAVHRFRNTRARVVLIQSHVRCFLATKAYRRRVIEINKASACITRFFKMAAAKQLRHRLSHQRDLDLLMKAQSQENAALSIQKCWSDYRFVLQRKNRAAAVLQSWCRAIISGKRAWTAYHVTRGKIITVQACYRGYCARKCYQETRKAALVVQRWWRNEMVVSHLRCSFLAQRHATVRIQTMYRGFAVRKIFHEKRNAAVTIQAVYRMYVARQMLRCQHEAATKIQSISRMHVERTRYTRIKSAVCSIETWYVALATFYSLRRRFVAVRQAVVTVQRCYRVYRTRREINTRVRNLITQTKAARVIEATYLSYRAARQQREQYVSLKRTVVVMQRMVRHKIKMNEEKRRHNAAVLIQNVFRAVVQTKHEQVRHFYLFLLLLEIFRVNTSCRIKETRKLFLLVYSH